jgi:hypothetical protein
MQVEYLWAPCAFLEPAGSSVVEVVQEEGRPPAVVTVVPVGGRHSTVPTVGS